MKFDVVVSNPPYQETGIKNKKRDSAANLWPRFVKLMFESLSKDGVCAAITPTGWLTPSSDIGKGSNGYKISNILKENQTLCININECKKHFPGVGSTFSYYVFKKNPQKYKTKIITEDTEFYHDISNITVFPSKINEQTLSINNKVLTQKNVLGFTNNNTTEGVKSTKDYTKQKDNVHLYKCLHSSANSGTFVYSSYKNKDIEKPKVLVCSSGKFLPIYDDSKIGYTNKMYVYILKEGESLNNIKTYIESKLVRAILDFNKSSGWVSYAFRMLPKIDLTRSWTNEELYKHFNLTKDEIKLIEDSVK